MGRKIGSKNKNTNKAKNKNIININVNTSTKRKRGRPSKKDSTNNDKTTRNQQLAGGGAYNTRAPVFTAPPPPVQYISPPQPDQTNSLLQSFITSRLLNESTIPNRTNMTYDEPIRSYEPSRRETLNFRESMIPKVEDTPLKTNVKPPPPPPTGPPPPPPPPPPKVKAKDVKPSTNTGFSADGLSAKEAITAELIYRASEEGKADFARKKAEKEARKAEKEANKEGKSMLDSMGMTFPSPFTPAKTTPSKSTAVIVRPQQQSMFDFVLGGGTPSKQYTKPTEEDVKKGAKIKRVKELNSKPDKTTKETLQYNDLRQELAGTPNENPVIASNAIKNAIKGKLARNEMKVQQSEANAKKIATQKDAASKLGGTFQRKLTKQFREAKKELDVKNTGEPLVVRPNTKELMFKKNRDRGLKSAATRASKQVSKEQEKIINFAGFMVNENKRKPFVGLKQTEI